MPETIHDSTYPNEQNRGYITFHLDAGQQHLDGATALKYARSRHSTSDFSRSLRQQLILRGIKDKIIASGFNVSTANELYETYTEFVHTNISAQELLRTTQFLEKVGDFSSFGFTTHCSFSNFQRMNPACFLYTPPRDHFGGASVILPMDARSDKIEYYDEMQTFTRFITQHPQMVKENVSIEVINAIDKELAKEHRMGKGKFDQQLATKLKRYGFNVIETMERADSLSVSTLSINNLGDYTATIEALKTFVPDLQIAYNTGNVQS